MELHIYDSRRQLLRVTWGKVITEDSLRRHFEMLMVNTHYPRHLRIITSSSVEEVGFPLTKEYMQKISEWREEALFEYRSVSTAIYGVKPVPSAYISFFSSFFDSPKSCLREFSTEVAALEWLSGDFRMEEPKKS